VASGSVPGFSPSASGFHFANDFPDEPVFEIPLGSKRVPIGNAADGLCGGMVFAVRDLFEAHLAPPAMTSPPERGSPLFGYLVRRLIDSWNIPQGPTKYYLWMTLPDTDGWWGVHGLRWRTAVEEWPVIRAEIDAGHPAALGLVRTRSWNPMDLGLNHQVLAYAYDLDEGSGTLVVSVADPNHPDDDTVTLGMRLSEPARTGPPAYIPGEAPVRGFFHTPYAGRDPAGAVG
jgi:hypothetical protein